MIVSSIIFQDWIGNSCREEISLSSKSLLGPTHLIVFLPFCVPICLLIHLLWWDDNYVSTHFQILIFFLVISHLADHSQTGEGEAELFLAGTLQKNKQKLKSFRKEDNLLNKDHIRVLSAASFVKFDSLITLGGVCVSNAKTIMKMGTELPGPLLWNINPGNLFIIIESQIHFYLFLDVNAFN